jgi:hypothetical protein
MNRYVLIARHRAKNGRDGEFDKWYDRHVNDVLRCEGFVAAERFALPPGADGEYSYLTIYNVETDDLEAVKSGLRSRAGTAEMPLSDSVDRDFVSSVYWLSTSKKRFSA